MKNILAILLLVVSNLACSAEKDAAIVEPVKTEEKAAVPKRTCIKVFDSKLNKEVEKCKTIKIHKKHEGTIVPLK